ncbi:MAG TPA: VOC family protein [Actinomycetota bacterium]|nr:VOC family protein [Actinomycetota bacterium]
MGKRERYEPGTFSWVDLATTDAGAAKAFYGKLFGWDFEDSQVPGGAVYSMARLDGDQVAGLYDMSAEMRERGVPPNWTNYVTVEDADAAAARARDVGGTVHAEPFNVMDAGRMAIIQDPQGAMFAVWQPHSSIGATRVNDVGCLTMNELSTTDLDAAAAFYGQLFGWDVQVVAEGVPYWSATNKGRLNAGMTVVRGGAPPHWKPYFTVASCDAATETIGSGGGRVLAGPLDIPSGRIAVAMDPQGAAFAVFEGEVDPDP